jgi:hypothetical protein
MTPPENGCERVPFTKSASTSFTAIQKDALDADVTGQSVWIPFFAKHPGLCMTLSLAMGVLFFFGPIMFGSLRGALQGIPLLWTFWRTMTTEIFALAAGCALGLLGALSMYLARKWFPGKQDSTFQFPYPSEFGRPELRPRTMANRFSFLIYIWIVIPVQYAAAFFLMGLFAALIRGDK